MNFRSSVIFLWSIIGFRFLALPLGLEPRKTCLEDKLPSCRHESMDPVGGNDPPSRLSKSRCLTSGHWNKGLRLLTSSQLSRLVSGPDLVDCLRFELSSHIPQMKACVFTFSTNSPWRKELESNQIPEGTNGLAVRASYPGWITFLV